MDSTRTWSNKSDDADDRVADCEDRPEDCYRLAVANIICCIHVGRVHVLDFCSHFSSPALTSPLFPSLTLEKSPFFAKTIFLCDDDNNFTIDQQMHRDPRSINLYRFFTVFNTFEGALIELSLPGHNTATTT